MIEILVPYYRNPEMLKLQVVSWQGLPLAVRKQLRITIVDDGSPEPIDFQGDDMLNVAIYRIKQNIPWNIAGAKNLLAKVCSSQWFLMHDIDYVFNPVTLPNVFQLSMSNPSVYYNFHVENARAPARRRGSKIVTLMNKDTFLEVGGFNEAFSGAWGLQMSDFRQRLKRAKKKVKLSKITMTHFDNEDVADASTTDWERDSTENLNRLKDRSKQVKRLQFDWSLHDIFLCKK